MTRARKPAPRHASKRVAADPIVGWVERAIRLNTEVDAEADAISARYEAACPDEYRFGDGCKYQNPGQFPAGLQARYCAFNKAMGMGYAPDAPTDPRLTTAWRLEDKVRETPAKTLAGAPKAFPADAKLFKLEARRSALLVEAERIGAEEDRALARIKAKLGTDGWPVFDPSVPALQPVAKLLRVLVREDGTITLDAIEELNRALEKKATEWPGCDLKVWRRAGRARVRWWKQETVKIRAAQRAAGLQEIARRWSAVHARVDRLSDQIRAMRATSLAGVVVKLRVFQDEARKEFGATVPTDADFNPSILLGFSALADAERLLAKSGT